MKHNFASMKSQDKYSPKIGVNYQAEIPILINKTDYLLQENSSSLKFVTGLAVPVTVTYGENGYMLAPYSASEEWNEVENESFLLGLYIFGKNITQLKNFIQTKKKQDILAHYYGMFFHSKEDLKWSNFRKMVFGECVFDEEFFTGGGLQELLSRILPLVSKTCKRVVKKVSKQFEQGKTTLEDFINTMKSLVGMKNLVDLVGIGKGKKDLTCILEPLESYYQREFKTFSTFTSSEIVEYLNGNRRLSKLKSKAIFAAAVWPRLEKKGWHSEISKGNMVFLIPGIEEFNRKTLVKGNHYFDSISDVLNKVASDPGLLQDAYEIEKNERQYSYRYIDGMIFAVVDTSLAKGELHKLMEVKCLSTDIFTSFNAFVVESDHHDIVLPISEVQILENGNKSQEMQNVNDDDTNSKLKRGLEYKLGKRTNEDDSEGVAPDIKRRRCNQGETGNVVTSSSALQVIVTLEAPSNVPEPERPSCCRANQDNVEIILSSDGSLALKSNLAGSIGYDTANVEPQQTSRVHMFDLNLVPDLDSEPTMIDQVETQDHNNNVDGPVYNDASNTSQEATNITPQSQRRSTRNRPPTTRSLEAVANGFLTVKTRRRQADGTV